MGIPRARHQVLPLLVVLAVAASITIAPPRARSNQEPQLVGRTESSDTYENPDGTYTTRFYPLAKNYRAEDGDYRPIDPTIVVDGDVGFKNRAGQIGIRFAKSTDTGEPVRVQGDDWSIRFGMVGARMSLPSWNFGDGLLIYALS